MFRLKIIKHVVQKTLSKSLQQESCEWHQQLLKLKPSTFIFTNNITSNPKFSHVPTDVEKSEEQFLVRLKNDPDIFGHANEEEHVDEMDLEEDKHFEQQTLPSQKLRTKQYADIIKSLIKKRKIKEAIDVLEIRMLKDDRVKPEAYIYNLLLGACGRVGYTKKAFSLYNQMKKRGLKVMGGTYTALFNACANSPWPEDGLTRARHLQNIMIEKMYEPNHTNYNAMIKAFGRCGDLPTAFSLVDEMAAKGFKIESDTINFLLQACIQDKEAGFRHALLVWRKIIDKNIAPNSFTYNLMLRCVRDCGFGDIKAMEDFLETILNKSHKLPKQNDDKLLTDGSQDGNVLIKNINMNSYADQLTCKTTDSLDINTESNLDLLRPNLMARVPHLGNIISLSEVSKAEDRLLLVGGFKGFLNNMVSNNCEPNIKSFTQLLDCLPGSITAENELLRVMKKLKVKPDIDFFNMLIKKRSMRFDYESAKAVLEDIQNFNYRPNLITYGVLALGCKTKSEAIELMNEMKDHSYRLNTEILGAMLHQACHHKSFPYVLEIMETTLRENVKPNKMFMDCLEDFKKKCKYISNDKEDKLSENLSFQKGYRIFRMRYKTWLEKVEVDDTDESHPWTQYRQSTDTDTRHYKDKSDKFKAKCLSRFKVKTSAKHKQRKQ